MVNLNLETRPTDFSRLNKPLVIGGILSAIAALLHIAIIIGGADWYQFFGAGEELTNLAAQGSVVPDLITVGISLVLYGWAMYAFSGAGLIKSLPYIKWVLLIATAIYLFRGLAVIPAVFIQPDRVDLFLLVSSCISATIGMFYAIGTRQWLWEHK